MPEPLHLSNTALVTVLQLAQPLSPIDRSLFLEDIAAALRGHPDLWDADGLVIRTARDLQHKYLRPVEPAELRRQSLSRIPGTRLAKPNGKGNGGDQAA